MLKYKNVNILIALLFPLILNWIEPFHVNNLACWIVQGNEILQSGRILKFDVFSVLATGEMVYPDWSLCILYSLLYKITGLIGVCIFHQLVLGLLAWLIYRSSLFLLKGEPSLTTRLALIAFWLGAMRAYGERPAMVALIPLVLAYTLIEKKRKTGNWTYADFGKLSMIQVAWANLHGSFILLPLMLGWGLNKKPLARLGIVLAVTASALLNPFSWKIFPYVFETAMVSSQRAISEWGPLSLTHYLPTGPLFLLLIAGLIYAIVKKPEILGSPFIPIAALGFSNARNAGLAFVLLLPFLYFNGWLTSVSVDESRKKLAPRLVVLSGFLALLVGLSPWMKPHLSEIKPITKVYAAEKLKVFDFSAPFAIGKRLSEDATKCSVLNDWELGSFLMLVQHHPTFLDGRNTIFNDTVFEKNIRVLEGRTNLEFLKNYIDRYDICYAALLESRATLITQLKTLGWKKLLSENGVVLMGAKKSK